MSAAPLAATPRTIEWIRPLAQPYLRGYKARVQRDGSLRGYWFWQPAWPGSTRGTGLETRRNAFTSSGKAGGIGFFVGYLIESAGFDFLGPRPPESLVFVFVGPMTSAAHGRLVSEPGSLVRKTFEYIRWLTHRPPRFVFHEHESAAMARHVSMLDWPAEKYEHLSGNFFIETLAWLVRSGLVRRLRAESRPSTAPRKNVPKGSAGASSGDCKRRAAG